MSSAPRMPPPPPPLPSLPPLPQANSRPASISFEYEELWFSLMRRNWRSLALAPIDPGDRALELAHKLSVIGKTFRSSALTLIDATQLDLEGAARITQQLQSPTGAWYGTGAQAERGAESRTLVALDPPRENALTIPVALAVDTVILLVERGRTQRAAIERTIQLLGRELVLGAILLGK